MGVYAVKGVLVKGNRVKKITVPTAGDPTRAAFRCLENLLAGRTERHLRFGLTGHNARLIAGSAGIEPLLEIEALQAGLLFWKVKAGAVISLGHENMYYLELDPEGNVTYFSRNGQCAAGSGAFWYQQATRMGYNDRELAEIALEAESPVRISGRCAVFAKSDMTHAINEGAAQSAVCAGMARTLVENLFTGVARDRIKGPGVLAAVGGVAENRAVLKYLQEYAGERSVKLTVPANHTYINALGAALRGSPAGLAAARKAGASTGLYRPDNPLPRLDPDRVNYLSHNPAAEKYDLSTVFLGVDCGSVSTKCVLLDRSGRSIGGVYLPTTGRPALQVLELIKRAEHRYGRLLAGRKILACTTGSGRFLSQKILNAEYAVDEITCQAEAARHLFGDTEPLSIIEIGGEDSKYLQLKNGMLHDYNMNPVCAAGTGTFLENLAELLGVNIKEEFSRKAFQADYAVDLGDTCTLLSQSTLVAAASRGLPLASQLASLAYSAARNYLSKTVDKRTLEGKLIFTGATARNTALAAAFAAECGCEVTVPPEPELSGALGAALTAKIKHENGEPVEYSFRSFKELNRYDLKIQHCRSGCEHGHNCALHVIRFSDGGKFIYGDRCGKYSNLERAEEDDSLPDYGRRREELFSRAAGDSAAEGPRVGLARCGLFFELYPAWAAFFRELGARVVLSGKTTDDTLEKGKRELDAEMCYPMKVIVGHYRELAEQEPDYIFVPEVVDMEALPWAPGWPRGFTCPLLQTLKGTVVNSLSLDEGKLLYAQLNYRDGPGRIEEQLRPVARKLLGKRYRESLFRRALAASRRARESFEEAMEAEGRKLFTELPGYADRVVAVFLSRSYTVYDEFVSKGSLGYARRNGMPAIPQEFLLAFLRGWLAGRFTFSLLDPFREEFRVYLAEYLHRMDHIYPVQLQRMLSTVLLVNFLNQKARHTGFPVMHIIFQDPFKCGPNAMLRHYLSTLTGYLRLTLDEHTAAAGMITRLEAFKNTCRSKGLPAAPLAYSARTRTVADRDWDKILIPEPSGHAHIFAAMFRRYGVDAAVLSRSMDPDLSLARRYANGEECLPFMQNLQDYLDYLEQNGAVEPGRTVFFQGWASGPCRYGLYAPTQSLTLERAGYGPGRVCAVKLADIFKRFGFAFAVGVYNGTQALDLLYKMLHTVRPYETEKGAAEALFQDFAARLARIMERFSFSPRQLPSGSYLKPLEQLLGEASSGFTKIQRREAARPRILVGGEFYVRLDDRSNEAVIKKIEDAGGETCLAPASELFNYTAYIDYREARQAYLMDKNWRKYLEQAGYFWINRLIHRDEVRLERAAAGLLHGQEEPHASEIARRAARYITGHYGGEPPMTIGRAAAFAGRERVAGAVFVAPFTCMPGSYVEAQQGMLQEELHIPVITVYYDGKESANRDELVESLVFQARQHVLTGGE